MSLQQLAHVRVKLCVSFDLDTFGYAGSPWVVQGAPDYARIGEAVLHTGQQCQPMGIGDIAAVRVKHSLPSCEL
eukprot:14930425-Heterocapsa_arctica.AAC.1